MPWETRDSACVSAASPQRYTVHVTPRAFGTWLVFIHVYKGGGGCLSTYSTCVCVCEWWLQCQPLCSWLLWPGVCVDSA